MRSRLIRPLSIVAFALSGCGTNIPQLLDVRESLSANAAADEHRRLARDYEVQGQWVRALREWRIVHALSPNAEQPVTEVNRLQAKVTERSRRHYRAAMAAKARGDAKTARSAALRALALDPELVEAMELLRSLEANAVRMRLAAAPTRSKHASQTEGYDDAAGAGRRLTGARTTAVLSAPGQPINKKSARAAQADVSARKQPNLTLGVKALADGELHQALRYFEAAKRMGEAPESEMAERIKSVRRDLADHHYSAGVAKFRASRYRDAVLEFQRVLEYDPGHSKARLYRSSATKLQN